MEIEHRDSRAVLLRRKGLVFVPTATGAEDPDLSRAAALQLSDLGFLPSSDLQRALSALGGRHLAPHLEFIRDVLLQQRGGDQKHVPLFRNFPEDIPEDTTELWWKKVLNHYLQAEGQSCLFCGNLGTTHVLNPCSHVVCEVCFDGSNYSACPICEHHVDQSSPFFKASKVDRTSTPKEQVRFTVLIRGENLQEAAQKEVAAFCARPQALSPTDKEDFEILLRDFGEDTLAWLPEEIPLKENVALVFGVLFQVGDPDRVLAVAKKHLKTATDVLRFIAAYSGADPSLQRETIYKAYQKEEDIPQGRFWGAIAKMLGVAGHPAPSYRRPIPMRVNRFKVAKLSRPLRRGLLGLLEGLHPDLLTEDMLRHQSHWVWVGQFLHPHEYAKRFPNVARAFSIVRKKAPDGTRAQEFRTFYGKMEHYRKEGALLELVDHLKARPGEFGRRLDLLLRLAENNDGAQPEIPGRVLDAFETCLPRLATPMLLTLRNHFQHRNQKAGVRIYWPKGTTARGISSPDERPTLSDTVVERVVGQVEAEILKRYGALQAYGDFVIDEELRAVLVPFNERTASPAAIDLPRGSRVPLPPGKVMRLFLHWCEPEKDGRTTDLDLSVGFYDADWKYVGVCSYYQLRCPEKGADVAATSAGDLRSAPFPDGATEFIDLNWEKATQLGIRYAVMVVNAYAGMTFGQLERAFAGFMVRDDTGGKHFDPRTVELKFALQGDHGIFMPAVVDVEERTLHWVDTYARGGFAFNNVATSNQDIQRICPEMMTYFASGTRMSMYDLAILHAAARGKRVFLRGEADRLFVRDAQENALDFLARLKAGDQDGVDHPIPSPKNGDTEPLFAALYWGNVEVPEKSRVYALFREGVANTLAASDLIAPED
jgi:hypothetical protein